MEGGSFPPQMPKAGDAGSSIQFAIRFAPTGEGLRMATLTVLSSDPNENPYTITLVGTGLNGGQKIINGSELTLLSPNGNEALEAGTFLDIRWKGGERAKCVKIEYSTDNGSAYQTIAERVANIGTFPWRVPDEASGSCLVRISDADGAPAVPAIIAYEFNFRISALAGEASEGGAHFVFRAGVPASKTQSFQVAEVAFAPDGINGTENLLFNHAMGEIPRPETFLGRWHRARITYDMTNYTGSVWVDNEPVLAGVPLRADLGVESPPELSLTRDGSVPVELWIDDVGVEFVDLSLLGRDAADVAFRPLFRDNFNRYESALFPRQGGWRPIQTEVRGEAAEEGAEVLRAAKDEAVSSGVDDRVYASSARSFKLEGTDEEPGRATKRFSLPERVPYCVSAEPFAIVVTGEAMPEQRRAVSSRDRETESKRQKRWDNEKEGRTRRPAGRSGPGGSKLAAGPVRSGSSEGMEDAKLMSGVPVSGAFYIYAFDGRLLAEYDVAGALVRDYIYFGGQLVAEYTGTQLFYYASDQINSTRIVTDSSGTVVYAAAHEPYGGIQKTWVTTYDPALKFSGKQRDAESDLDYFGARYYDRSQYRFISVDPIIITGAAMNDPQSWNLYSYCGNNPLVYIDSMGLYKKSVHYDLTYQIARQFGFTPAEARLVASADQAVDENPSTTSFNSRSNWLHFPSPAELALARVDAMNANNFIELGFYLHIIQDSYSHGGYSIPMIINVPGGMPIVIMVPVNKNTHWYLTVLSQSGICKDPDDPSACPSNYDKMVQETYYAFMFWIGNRIRFHNDVIFQNPCQ